MFMVDTSVWIDYFNGNSTDQTDFLRYRLGKEMVIIGDLILAETLQGFRADKDYQQAKRLLGSFPIVPLAGENMAYEAVNYYRLLRKKGVTVRKTMDILIGTYCVIESVPLLYSDRDFDPIVNHLGLVQVGKR